MSPPRIVSYAAVHGANVLGLVVSMGLGFVIPLLLSPEDLGRYSLLTAILSYFHHSHLGLRQALTVMVPTLEGRGERAEARGWEAQGVVWSAVAGLGVAAVVCAVAAVSSFATGTPTREGLVYVLLTALAGYAFMNANTPLVVYRARRLPFWLTATNVAIILVGGAARLAGVALSGLTLMLWLLAAGYAAVALFFLPRLGIEWTRPARPAGRRLFGMGFPLMVMGMASLAMLNGSRWLVGGMAGLEALGYFAFGSVFLGIVVSLPASIGEVFLPEFVHRLAGGPPPGEVARLVRKYFLYVSSIMAAGTVLGVALAPPLIERFYPRYVPGIEPAQLLIVGGFFLGHCHMPLHAFAYSGERQWKGALLAAATAVIQVACILAFLAGRPTPAAAGLGLVWGSLAAYVVTFAVFARAFRLSARDALFPFLYTTALGALVHPIGTALGEMIR
jgi:O-antigen/teichoic acid export membrane protein